jgi:hypothetical protein
LCRPLFNRLFKTRGTSCPTTLGDDGGVGARVLELPAFRAKALVRKAGLAVAVLPRMMKSIAIVAATIGLGLSSLAGCTAAVDGQGQMEEKTATAAEAQSLPPPNYCPTGRACCASADGVLGSDGSPVAGSWAACNAALTQYGCHAINNPGSTQITKYTPGGVTYYNYDDAVECPAGTVAAIHNSGAWEYDNGQPFTGWTWVGHWVWDNGQPFTGSVWVYDPCGPSPASAFVASSTFCNLTASSGDEIAAFDPHCTAGCSH